MMIMIQMMDQHKWRRCEGRGVELPLIRAKGNVFAHT